MDLNVTNDMTIGECEGSQKETITSDVTFEVSDTRKCVTINISDTMVEVTESFTVTLESLDERIQLGPEFEAEIEIIDDDSA